MKISTACGRWINIRHNGNAWRIYAKVFPGELRVYRIEGDVTSKDLGDALQLHADSVGLAVAMA